MTLHLRLRDVVNRYYESEVGRLQLAKSLKVKQNLSMYSKSIPMYCILLV